MHLALLCRSGGLAGLPTLDAPEQCWRLQLLRLHLFQFNSFTSRMTEVHGEDTLELFVQAFS